MMTCIRFRITFVSFLLCKFCDASNRSQLFKDVLDVQEVRVAPFNNQSEAIDLSVSLNLILINNLHERTRHLMLFFGCLLCGMIRDLNGILHTIKKLLPYKQHLNMYGHQVLFVFITMCLIRSV